MVIDPLRVTQSRERQDAADSVKYITPSATAVER
jgi:hypothetical protein